MNSTKTHRLAHLFALDDKCLIVALDHAGFMDQPLKGLERPVEMIRAVGRAAGQVVLEVRKQFRNPGIMEGTVKPDFVVTQEMRDE